MYVTIHLLYGEEKHSPSYSHYHTMSMTGLAIEASLSSHPQLTGFPPSDSIKLCRESREQVAD
jgi:hypothetical protein